MPVPSCPGCQELLHRVAELEAQVRQLLAKLNTNATKYFISAPTSN
jgi:hypothetical protein